jgi:hypothetical protein
MTGYMYDPVTRQYKDKDGKIIALAIIIALRDAIADDAKAEYEALTTAYLRGELTLTAWADAFAALIRAGSAAGYLLGRGGTNAMTPSTDDQRLQDLTDYHLKAARGFGADLAASDVSLGDGSPVLDDNGEIMVDDAGNPVDENGDPILDASGDPITLDEAAGMSGRDLISRAGSYESATISGYSGGQGAAWGVDPPETPPAHGNCRCYSTLDTDSDGQVIFNWLTADDERVCPICEGLAAEYSDWPTGTYDSSGVSDGGGDGG